MMTQGSQLSPLRGGPVFALSAPSQYAPDSSAALSGLSGTHRPWGDGRGRTNLAPFRVFGSAVPRTSPSAIRVDPRFGALDGLGTSSDRNLGCLSGDVPHAEDVVAMILKDQTDYGTVGKPPIPGTQEPNLKIAGSTSDARIGAFPTEGRVWEGVSPEAARFAKRHGFWGSALLLVSRMRSCLNSGDTVKLDVVADPEIDGWSILCATVRTNATTESVIDLDLQLREMVADCLSSAHSVYFAVRFDLVE
jgi:hypothetical protein